MSVLILMFWMHATATIVPSSQILPIMYVPGSCLEVCLVVLQFEGNLRLVDLSLDFRC